MAAWHARAGFPPDFGKEPMRKMKIKKSLQAAGLRTVYDYVDKDPRAHLPQVVSLLEKFVPAGSDMDGVIRGIKEGLADPDNNWNRFVLSLWDDIDAGARSLRTSP